MAKLSIRTRLIILSGALLFFLLVSNFYLNQKLNEIAAGMVKTADLLGEIEEANGAQIAFGEMRYWLTDLAVSMLTLSERNAAAATAANGTRISMRWPGGGRKRSRQFAPSWLSTRSSPARLSRNTPMNAGLSATRFWHEPAGTALSPINCLAAIVAQLTHEALAARETAVTEARSATDVSRIVLGAAVVVGAFLTLLVLRSIAVPLRQLVVAMNGLNAGDLAISIPRRRAR